jgi:lysozyme family protein
MIKKIILSLFIILIATNLLVIKINAQSVFDNVRKYIDNSNRRKDLIDKSEKTIKEINEFELNIESSNKIQKAPDESSSPSTYIQDININPDPNYTPTPLDLAISNNEVTYSQNLIDSVAKCTNTSNLKIYEQASKITAVPVQALAAIHYLEGSCNLNQSLVSGRKIGEIEPDVGKKCSLDDVGLGKPYPKGSGCIFRNTLDSAIYAGFFLRNNKFGGGIPKTIEDYAIAFGNYNGTGNRNCGRTPYRSCPPSFTNDDHIYAMSKFSAKHEEMYVVYCADRVKCDPPKRFNRPGALTIMNIFSKLL